MAEEIRRIPNDTLILVCNASKALFLRNAGTAMTPRFEIENSLKAPSAGEPRNADRPGRRPDRTGSGGEKGPRSAMEEPDWHKMDADDFASQVCWKLAALLQQAPHMEMILVAPPEMLGFLRRHMPDSVTSRVREEIAKDLTSMPVARITEIVVES